MRNNTLYLLLASTLICIFVVSCNGKKEASANNTTTSTGDDLIDQMTKELANDPNNAELLFNRANAYYEREEYEASIQDLESAMKIDSIKPEYHHLLADNYFDYARSRDALRVMQELVRRYPEHIPSLLKLSEMQLLLGQYENSIFTVNEILMRSPRDSEAYFMLGMNFRAMEETEKSINSFQTAVEINPDMTDAWLILGELHEKIGSPNAIKFIENAERVAPENIEVLHHKAYYLQNHDDIPQALELYRKINVLKPSYGDAYLNAGILYFEIDSLKKAYEQFDILAGIEPQNYLAYYYRGLLHMADKNMTLAKADLQSAVNLNSNFERAQKALSEVNAVIASNEG